jgi:hypothetical protein
VKEGVTDNVKLSCASFKSVSSKVGHIYLLFVIIIFCESLMRAAIAQGTTDKIIAGHPEKKNNFVFEEAFVFFNLSYSAGSGIAKASLICL